MIRPQHNAHCHPLHHHPSPIIHPTLPTLRRSASHCIRCADALPSTDVARSLAHIPSSDFLYIDPAHRASLSLLILLYCVIYPSCRTRRSLLRFRSSRRSFPVPVPMPQSPIPDPQLPMFNSPVSIHSIRGRNGWAFPAVSVTVTSRLALTLTFTHSHTLLIVPLFCMPVPLSLSLSPPPCLCLYVPVSIPSHLIPSVQFRSCTSRGIPLASLTTFTFLLLLR